MSAERSELRSTTRIDYKKLNTTGEKVILQADKQSEEHSYDQTVDSSSVIKESVLTDITQKMESKRDVTSKTEESKAVSSKELHSLRSKYSLIKDEIDDFMDENPVNVTTVFVSDIDACLEKISKLRTDFRVACNEMNTFLLMHKIDENYSEDSEAILNNVKEYIIHAKERKLQIRQSDKDLEVAEKTNKLKKEAEESIQKQQAAKFLINEVTRLTKDLHNEFSKDRDGEIHDEEVTRRKEELPSNLLKLEQLSSKFQRCLEIIPDEYEEKDTIINQITENYENLVLEKERYENFIEVEMKEREMSKEKNFKASSLNINIEKFKGYDSELDIYSFQYEFEKIHLKSTPKKMLPDLLKYNYLSEPALSLVKCLDNIDEMWIRLKRAYGDPKTLLDRKLMQVRRTGALWKVSGERLKESLMNLINGISDLISLSKYHGIENKLYHGDHLNVIYGLMGETRVRKWITMTCDEELEEEELWRKLIMFLEKELKVQQELSLIKPKLSQDQKSQNTYCSQAVTNDVDSDSAINDYDCHVSSSLPSSIKCSFCGEMGHYETKTYDGSSLVQYYACKKFVEMNPLERYKELRKLGLCYQCLFPGAIQNKGKHANGMCQIDFTCQHPSHDRYSMKRHVLVCHDHRNTDENKKILDHYKRKFILQRPDIPEFSKELKLTFMSKQSHISNSKNSETLTTDDSIISDNGIYMLQRVQIGDKKFTLFFDTGCSDMVAKHEAIIKIGKRARLEIEGPTTLGGVGNVKMESKHGIYQVRLPLVNGKDAVLAGVCLDKITNQFPSYPIKGSIENDIKTGYVHNGGDICNLPELPECIGGDVDFMIGAKYTRYHPQPIFSLPSGLTIYKSPFLSADGIQGVIGGPHAVITAIDRAHNNEKACQHSYLSDQFKLFQIGYQIDPDVHLLGMKYSKDFIHDLFHTQLECESNSENANHSSFLSIRDQKCFDDVENAASQILYRCPDCRNCQKCKNSERIESISIKEEVEQDIINQSVIVDQVRGVTEAKLPLIEDPVYKLAPNKDKALAIYNSQLKRLSKHPKDKEDVIRSERKLQELGHVEYVCNLSDDQQKKLKESPVQNFIPWSVVWKDNSLSTPCRVVFNASLPTGTGFSLNDILAKGRNNMNLLVEIFMRWRSHAFALHSDVQKMYNTVRLREEDWNLQRYIWHQELDPKCIPKEKVIKTLIYGVKSSGNQAERGLRMTATLLKNEYPEVHQIVTKDIYVDDCLTGESSNELLHQRADELSLVLMKGGFSLKGFTFSGSKPLTQLSDDGESIHVAGLKWHSENDFLQLDVGPVDFSKRVRGKRVQSSRKVPTQLTRRLCLSKVSEVFDLTGMITPLTASMKLDLHTLVERKLDWDDTIPADLMPIWNSNFEMINEITHLRFKRAIIPEDAVSLELETLDCADASTLLVCVTIYARFLRKTGEYSCQLVFSRSKLIPTGMSIPRAELFAANINAHTGEIVKRSFKNMHVKCTKLTDSQVTLHWINNQELPLKQWSRNRVVEILRFTVADQWKYVKSADMPADLGTRKGATLKDVNMESSWQNGFEWMRLNESEFPVKTYNEITSLCINASEQSNEIINGTTMKPSCHLTQYQESVLSRYEYSGYVIDPNKFRFEKVLRILALVKRFINKCQVKNPQHVVSTSSGYINISDEELQDASKYFFKKGTQELMHFNSKDKYEKISFEKDGILYYSGRILPSQEITSIQTMTDTMRDLSSLSFCVPLIEKHSPLAYSIINEIHWHHESAKHSGVETTLRYTMKYAYIVEGRDLVKQVKKSCVRCKILLKRTLNVSMGPISSHSLTIAPAFYVTQTDISGPFKAYTPHNKRTTIKIWHVIFCCITTSTVSIKVMESYCTTSFIQAFIRFSCEVGYPKIMLIDEGSQLVKGCQDIKLNFRDIQQQLHKNQQIQFEVCPVGGHNMHGKVERKVKSAKESIEKTLHNERLSILQWETSVSQISNSMNDLPLALPYSSADLEYLDLITPNRLRLGRNNERSPCGVLTVSNDPLKFAKVNTDIFNTWFEAWLVSHVPKLMNQPKWYDSDRDLKSGDIVLFLKNDKELCSDYQYGKILSTKTSSDGKIRSAEVLYRNSNEIIDRTTTRAARQLVRIHSIDELDIVQELGEVATLYDLKYKLQHQ